MKFITKFTAFIAIFSSPVYADWVMFRETVDVEFYYSTNYKKDKGVVGVRVYKNYSERKSYEIGGKTIYYSSSLSYDFIDCNKNLYMMSYLTVFEKKNLGGKEGQSSSLRKDKWEKIKEETMISALRDIVCKVI